MLLTVRNLSKAYGAVNVLQDLSFVINAHERVGVVGPNGVGKSTLLRILTDQEEADNGSLTYGPAVEFGYLAQSMPDFYGHTLHDMIMDSVGHLRQLEERMHQLEQAMATTDETALNTRLEEYHTVSTRFQDRGGYELDYKIDVIMHGLRLDYLPREREVETLSGGEKARLGLATLLLRSPDILLLDEPTNHLDFASIEWLETYLSEYHGAAMIVSHDRQFLNRAINRIFEIDEHSHNLKVYEGDYDAYVRAKAAERIKWEQDYERQQEEIKALRKRVKDAAKSIGHTYRAPRDNDKSARNFFEENVQNAVSSKIRQAQAELARIEADPVPKPPEILRVNSQFSVEPMQSQLVLQMRNVAKGFDSRQLFHDLNFTLGTRARIMLVGPNGAGKTTLLRLIMGQEQPDEGDIQIVSGARIGYLPQDPVFSDQDKSVIDTYRYGQIGHESEFVARLIGYGLFRLEDMTKKVRQLSLGQRRKLEIARMLANHPNALLLDEPTNYISLDVLEAFENSVLGFPGPVIAISHDRWFIQRFGGQVWELARGHFIKHEEDATTYLKATGLEMETIP